MQDTILKYHNFPKKEGIEKLGSWLKSVCIRKALDKLREKHRTKEFLEEYKEEQIPAPPPQVQYTVEEIRKITGADSLGYLRLEDVTKLAESGNCMGYCTACFDGKYPTKVPPKRETSKYDRKISENREK